MTIGDRYRNEMFALMSEVLQDIGARESCSAAEKRLGRLLGERWRSLGLEVREETFQCHPRAFLGFIPFASLLYLAAVLLYWWMPLACALLAGVAMALIWFELLRYRELIDPLFAAAEGTNVVGVIQPAGPARQRVLISAHQDSAYEFNLWFFLKNAAVPIMVIAFAAPLVPFAGGLVQWLAGSSGGVLDTIGWVSMGLYPFVGLNLFFHTYSVVPGAMDNLAGIAVLHGVGSALSEAARSGSAALQQTEVVLLATSSEEAGLRGSKRYVAAHAEEMRALPTYGLFVDGVYDERYLSVVSRELLTGARHDLRLVQLAKDVAAVHGWPIVERIIPFGATDGTAFSTAGVPSVALLCQDMSRLVPNYHTRLDTLDRVRPESLAVMLQLVVDMLKEIDDPAGIR